MHQKIMRPMLSTQLQNNGYTTGAFQCNPFLSSHYNYNKGFDEFKDYQNPLMGVASKIFPRGIEINNPKLRQVDEYLHITDIIKKTYQLIKGKPRPYVAADVITDDTIDWISNTNNPFFCWTHYMDVHHPCFPPEKHRENFEVADVTQTEVSNWYSTLLRNPEALNQDQLDKLKKLYNASVEFTKTQIGRILNNLKSNQEYDNTLIILTSDHGELFGEHDQYGKPERLYNELLHVPLIIENGPEYLENAKDHLISLLDVPPLIHDTVGIQIPSSYEGQIPGRDDPRKFIMAEHEVEGEVIVGARSEEWLFEGDEINKEHRLFHIGNEFKQKRHDLKKGETVRKAVLQRLDELDVEAKYLKEDISEDIEERLDDLGYL
jgi:arylsulfatase A-like enzyme